MHDKSSLYVLSALIAVFALMPHLLALGTPELDVYPRPWVTTSRLIEQMNMINEDFVSITLLVDGSVRESFVRQALYNRLARVRYVYNGRSSSIVSSELTRIGDYYVFRIHGPRETLARELQGIIREGASSLIRNWVLKPVPEPASRVFSSSMLGEATTISPSGEFSVLDSTIRDLTGARLVNQTYGINGSRVRVAIVDTGIDYGHGFLRGTLDYYEGWYYDASNNLVWIREPLVLDADMSQVIILADLTGTGTVTLPLTGVVYTPSRTTVTRPRTSVSISNTTTPSISGVRKVGYTYLYLSDASGTPAYRRVTVLLTDPVSPYVYTRLYIDLNNNGIFGEASDIVVDYNGSRILSNGTHSLGVAGGFFYDTAFAFSNGRILPGWDLQGRYISIFYDFEGHGTSCASAVAGLDPSGVATGIAPGAKIIGVKALWYGNTEIGLLWAAGFDIDPFTRRVYYAGRRADIISNSWGISSFVYDITGFGYDFISTIATALTMPRYLDPMYPGVAVLFAGGNGGGGYGIVTSAGASPGVITVGASTSFHVYTSPTYGYADYNWDQIIGWSSKGPAPSGYLKPDVVLIGWLGYTASPMAWGRGNATTTFSGTSYATPLTAGVVALILDSLISKYGEGARYTDPTLLKHLLMNTADFIGYHPLEQGAGRPNALRAVEQVLFENKELVIYSDTYYNNIAQNMRRMWNWYWLDYIPYNILSYYNAILWASGFIPARWSNSPYYGVFLPWIKQGSSKTFTLYINNTLDTDLTATIRPVKYSVVSRQSLTIPMSLLTGSLDNSTYIILDASDIPVNAVLMDIEASLPYKYFDGDRDYRDDYLLLLYSYIWVKDVDGNGYPYNPAASNRPLQAGEVVYVNYGLNNYTYNRLQISRPRYWLDYYAQKHPFAKLVIRVRLYSGSDTTKGFAQLIDVPVNLTITYYELLDDDSITIPGSITIPSKSQVALTGLISADVNKPPSTYQSYILIDTGSKTYYVPVTYTVFREISEEYPVVLNELDDLSSSYTTSHIRGHNDWSWRYEAGDWRVFYVMVSDSNIIALEVNVTWTYENTSLVAYVLGPDGQFAGAYLGQSVSWHRNLVDGIFMWHATGGLGGARSTIIFPTTRYRQYSYPTSRPNTGIYTILVRTILFGGDEPLERFYVTVRAIKAIQPAPSHSLPPNGTLDFMVKFPYPSTTANLSVSRPSYPVYVFMPVRTITTSSNYTGSFPANYVFVFNINWSSPYYNLYRTDVSLLVQLVVPDLPVISRRGTTVYTNTTLYILEDWLMIGSVFHYTFPFR